MKVWAVIKLIEADGWHLARMRGSHRQFKHPVQPGLVTVAGRPGDELPPGTLNSVLRQAGLKNTGNEEYRKCLMFRYGIVIEKAAHNYAAYVPDLPGCVATGDTPEETEQNIREAISFHLEGLVEAGLPVPEPSAVVAYVEAV